MATELTEYDIALALAAHCQHRKRLSATITGAHEEDESPAPQDDRCDFGRWLDDIVPVQRDAARHQICKQLHSDFHAESDEAMRLASSEQPQFQAAIPPDSGLAEASELLTAAMLEWWRSRVDQGLG